MKVLLTGAAGFVGSHVLRHLLMNTDWEVVAPVSFRHRGTPARIASSICDLPEASRLTVLHWDMRAPADGQTLRALRGSQVIMNVASESHVDRSIEDPAGFIGNNVSLMVNLLDVARLIAPELILHMSTDEVYGPAAPHWLHQEWEVIAPSNPYSASKAAQEAIAFSYWRTYGLPIVTTNTMNILGEMQDREKFLPMIIRNVRDHRPITVHTSTTGEPGSRFYLHARNLADAWVYLTKTALSTPYRFTRRIDLLPGHTEALQYVAGVDRPPRFNIVGEREVDNIELVDMVGAIMGIYDYEIEKVSFHASRPGHDLRYALDGSKLADFGWSAPVPFFESLQRTVEWTLKNPEWLE